jgi:hypothetical protein
MKPKPLTPEILAQKNLDYENLKTTPALASVIDTLAKRLMNPDTCDPVIYQSIAKINEQKLFLQVTGPENVAVFKNLDAAEAFLKTKVREKIRELNPPNAHDRYKELNEQWIKFRLRLSGIQDLPSKRVVYQRISDVTPSEQIRLLSTVLATVSGRKVTDEILTETAAKLKITLRAKKERTPAPDPWAMAQAHFGELSPFLSATPGHEEKLKKFTAFIMGPNPKSKSPKSKSKSRGSQPPASGGPTIPSTLPEDDDNAPPVPVLTADPVQPTNAADDDKKLDAPTTPQAPATAADQPVAVVESTPAPAPDIPAPLPSPAPEAKDDADPSRSPAPAAPDAEGTAKSAEAPTPAAEKNAPPDTSALKAPAPAAVQEAVAETATTTPAPTAPEQPADTVAPAAAAQKTSPTLPDGIPVQFAADPAKRELYLVFKYSAASAHIASSYKFKATRDNHGTFRHDGFRFDSKEKNWYWIIATDVDFEAKSTEVQRALADAGAHVEVIAPRVAA